MTATLYAFPGCAIDQEEVADQRFVADPQAKIRAYLVGRVDHPAWCQTDDECMIDGRDLHTIHRAVVDIIQGLRVIVEQVDDHAGIPSVPGIRVDGAPCDLLPAEVRRLIKALWTAHDLGGGAA